MTKTICVEGMQCSHCQASVEKALSAVEGVSSATVDLAQKTATVELESDVSDNTLMEAVNNAGFNATSVTQ